MNPFSGFLQPPQQRSPLAGAAEFVQGLSQLALQRQQQAFQEKEAGIDNTRADANLKLQQDYQKNTFNEADQKKVQGLLAEYQDAEDQGDPVRLQRAKQALEAFGGASFSQGPQAPSTARPAPLPGQGLPDLKAFRQDMPIDAIAREEMATREKLRARTEDPMLSQEDFEADLVANPTEVPESAPDEPVEDVDSPEYQAAAAREVVDLDAEDPTPLTIGQGLPKVPSKQQERSTEGPQVAASGGLPAAQAASLPGQGLPTVISKGGKNLYTSQGPSGRWVPMVQGVFEGAANHADQEFAAAGKRAQETATKLIAVDGISPEKAIKMATEQLQGEMANINKMRGIELSTRPRWGGGGGGTGLLGKTQDIAESIQIYDDNARVEAAKIQEEDRQYEAIEAAISSGNPALQRDAVNVLLKVRSGSAVTASEDARISQINGLIAQVQDRFGRWTGGSMTPDMVRTIRQIAVLKRQVSAAKIKRIYEHQAKLYKAQNQGKTKDPNILEERAKTLQAGGGTSDPNADLYE